MKNKNSILEILYKYRNKNQRFYDKKHYLAKHGKKIDNINNFTKISSDDTTSAYFDNHTHTVVIINKDGYIDNLIYLYDKYLQFFDSKDIEIKLTKLLDIYYFSTKTNFIESLYENGFISYRLYEKIKKKVIL